MRRHNNGTASDDVKLGNDSGSSVSTSEAKENTTSEAKENIKFKDGILGIQER